MHIINMRVHRTTGTMPFGLVLSQQTPSLQVEKFLTAIPEHELEKAFVAQVER